LIDNIFREYDIRGIAGEDITRDTAFLIGKASAHFLKQANPEAKCVSVGRDVRTSSPDLASGAIEGIVSTGIDVQNIGTCPTPLEYFSIFDNGLDGGIMITGSHNPPEYNGFKINIGKDTIWGNDIQKLKEIIMRQDWQTTGKDGKVEDFDIVSRYKEYMLGEFLYLANPKYKKLKVVLDAGNGTAGIVAPGIAQAIGCDVIPLYCEPDGRFPNHHPDPTVIEYIQDLISTVKQTGADIGIAFDGDADRIGVVDRDGDIIWGDQLMIILSRELLKRKPCAKIIGDVKCSQLMFDDIKNNGGIPIMWKTGHSLIKQKMKEENAMLAGEFSGHIFIKDRYFGYDDAIYAALRLIEIMKTTGMSVKELLSGVPRMFYTPEIRIECPDEIKKETVNKIVAKISGYKRNGQSPCQIIDVNTIDGVRIVFDKGWGLVRSSNTQPVVVLRIEAQDEISMKNYRAFLEEELKQARVQ